MRTKKTFIPVWVKELAKRLCDCHTIRSTDCANMSVKEWREWAKEWKEEAIRSIMLSMPGSLCIKSITKKQIAQWDKACQEAGEQVNPALYIHNGILEALGLPEIKSPYGLKHLTPEIIKSLRPGPATDKLVAEAIGWKAERWPADGSGIARDTYIKPGRGSVRVDWSEARFSENLALAIETGKTYGHEFQLSFYEDHSVVSLGPGKQYTGEKEDSDCMMICKAILLDKTDSDAVFSKRQR